MKVPFSLSLFSGQNHMTKLYDNYLGYPTVIKLAFCDRRGKKIKV